MLLTSSNGSDIASGLFFGAFGIFILFFILFAFLIGIAFFLVRAYALYRIAQRMQYEYAWLAWIPFAQEWLYARVIGEDLKIGTVTIPQFPWVWIAIQYGSSIISAILSLIPFVGSILTLLLVPFLWAAAVYVMYRFFKLFTGGNEVVYTVICAIFPVVFPFLLLYLKDKPFANEAPAA